MARRPLRRFTGCSKPKAMHRLKPMLKHQTVNFIEDVLANSDLNGVRPDAKDVSIKGSMVNLAKRNAICHLRLASARIFDDMGCVKKGGMLQRAHAAGRLVRP